MPRKDINDYVLEGIKNELENKQKNLNKCDTNKDVVSQIASINKEKDSNNTNVEQFRRINVNVSNKNLDKLRRYQEKYGVMVSTKCSELLNKAIEEMQFDTN